VGDLTIQGTYDNEDECNGLLVRGRSLAPSPTDHHVTSYPVSWGPWLTGRDPDRGGRDWAVDSTHEAISRRVPLHMWAVEADHVVRGVPYGPLLMK
jgi:hypothetical protein